MFFSKKWSDAVGESYYAQLKSLVDNATTEIDEICATVVLGPDKMDRDRKWIEGAMRGVETGGKSFGE